MNEMPKISVVMPTYNSIRFIRESIESILNQTFVDFELIIIDDGSTDGSSEVIAKYKKQDERIYVYTNSKNQGIVASLNRGLACARGRYIARMDADDICHPIRFQKQIEFLNEHPSVGILGCAVQYINSAGTILGVNSYPLEDTEIRWTCLFSNPFAHPTVMMRNCILTKNSLLYDPLKQNVEDYDLWVRLLDKTKGANLKEALLQYRVHPSSITSNYKEKEFELLTDVVFTNITEKYPELNLTFDNVGVVTRSLVGHQDYFLHKNQRAEAAITYLKTWRVFSSKYLPEEMRSIQNRTVLIASKLTLYPLFQHNWCRALVHLFKMDPFWPIKFLLNLPSMLINKTLSNVTHAIKYKNDHN